MTCAVHLESIGRLVCGHDDGTIVMFYPAQAATILLLSPRRMTAGEVTRHDMLSNGVLFQGHKTTMLSVGSLLLQAGLSTASCAATRAAC